MNHRLKFRWTIWGLELMEVWCPADHGGECDCLEVDTELHEDGCATHDENDLEGECDCVGYGLTGKCWAKENLAEFVANGDGWYEVLHGDIDLPWVSATINGPGPYGDNELTVDVIAEVADPVEP